MKVDKVSLHNSSVKSLQWKLQKVVLIPDIHYSTQYFWFLHTMTDIENEWDGELLNILPQHWKTMQLLNTQHIYLHVYNYVESSLKYPISNAHLPY